jgi:alpha-N-arabinofuranosidase
LALPLRLPLRTGDRAGPTVDVPSYENATYGTVPYIDAAAVWHEDTGEIDLFAVNRHKTEPMEISARLGGFVSAGKGYACVENVELRHDDVKAVNTEADPDNVAPRKVQVAANAVDGERFSAAAAPLSWNLYRLAPR